MKHIVTLVLLLCTTSAAWAQSVGVGTTTPDPSAALDVKSSNQGLLPPRLTAAQRVAISSPAKGLLVYQTDGTPGYYYFSGTSWINLTTSGVPDATGNLPQPSSYATSNTLAGGIQGFSDGTVTTARFGNLNGVTVDSRGNVYVADLTNHAIRRISTDGLVTTVAGTGTAGDEDDFGTSAFLSSPAGLAVGPDGTVYIADQNNHKIKMILPSGSVRTLAGTGLAGANNGLVATARFSSPTGVAVGPDGTVYVADQGNHRIRQIRNGQVTTLAGTGTAGRVDGALATAQFNQPTGLAIDGQGTLYVADQSSFTVRTIRNGQVATLAGTGSAGSQDGPGASASFNRPTSVAVDGQGNVYVADMSNNRIRLISPSGQVTTFAGGTAGNANGTGTQIRMSQPFAVALDARGTVYVAERGNVVVRRIGGALTELTPVIPTPSLSLTGSTLTISGGNSVTIPSDADNLGNHTATQSLRLNGNSLSNNGTGGLRIDNSGNVGIGTATPIRRLDVNGSIRQQVYSQPLNLGAGIQGHFPWYHGLGYQPTLMLSVEDSGNGGAGMYITLSYEHVDNNTTNIWVRNTGGAANFRVRWIRVD